MNKIHLYMNQGLTQFKFITESPEVFTINNHGTCPKALEREYGYVRKRKESQAIYTNKT